jgi:hypothetical protein
VEISRDAGGSHPLLCSTDFWVHTSRVSLTSVLSAWIVLVGVALADSWYVGEMCDTGWLLCA